MAVVRRLLIIAAICAVLCKIYVTALKIKINVNLQVCHYKRLLKQKWLFRCNLIFLFVQGAKRWKQRRAVVLFLLFHCTKQTFASFNVDVFRQQGENVKFVDFATFFHIICFIQQTVV